MPLRCFLGLLCAAIGLHSFAVNATVHPVQPHCGYANGSITAVAVGGVPPYTYAWSTGATTQTITGLPPGSYTVTVADGLGNTDDETVTLADIPDLGTIDMLEARSDCAGSCSGILWFSTLQLLGQEPYTYDWQFPQVQGTQVFLHGFCGYQPTGVTVTDANGCAGTLQGMVSDAPMGAFASIEAYPACGGADNGRIVVQDPIALQEGGLVEVQDISGATTYYPTGQDPLEIDGLAPGSYTVMIVQDEPAHTPVYCFASSTVTVGDDPGPCGGLSGEVYFDLDHDCIRDPGDIASPYRVLTVEPGPIYLVTDANGGYAAPLAYGSYTLEQALDNEEQLCPSTTPVPFTLDATAPEAQVALADTSLQPYDLDVMIHVTGLQPGFPYHIWGSIHNGSIYPSGPVSVTLSTETFLGAVGATPAPVTNVPGTVTWTLPPVAGMGSATFSAYGIVPADITLLGQAAHFSVSIDGGLPEDDMTDNTYVVDATVVGSYDPNDKQAITDAGNTDGYFLGIDQEVTYTVRFQNTGTAPATTVIVRDTIEADLDLTSLRIHGASHAFVSSIAEDRALTFTFDNIQLPDSGSDQLGSQGYVSFSLRPVAGIVVGDVLTNTAGIYFDFNPPVITNTTALPVEVATSVTDGAVNALRPFPNPADRTVTFVLPGNQALLDIRAADGRRVQVPMTRNGDAITLELDALAPGLYTVRAGTGTARFIKR